ncbi:MAG TPA: hypothetical protein VLR26_02250 [Frankiaceae bacterium]|nr:hypothetical protein [Frankiaceae bacterium]
MVTTSGPALTAIADEPARSPAGTNALAAHGSANRTDLHFTVAVLTDDISMPPLDKLACYSGLAGAAAIGVISWPIAMLTEAGHLLAKGRIAPRCAPSVSL